MDPKPTTPDPRLAGHMPGLDGLRGLAALLIVYYHYASWQWVHTFPGEPTDTMRTTTALLQYGWLGVDVFFVLSGFLITGILIKTRTHPHYFKYFYARRALRIFPLYYAALVGALIVAPLLLTTGPGEEAALQHQAWLWLYGTNFAMAFGPDGLYGQGWMSLRHFWSLAVEEHFYLVWPLIVYLTPPRRLGHLCLVFIAAGIASRLACYAWFDPQRVGLIVRAITPCHIDKLAVGGLLAFTLHHNHTTLERLRPWATSALAATLIFLTACGIASVRHETFLMQNVGYPLITLASAGAIVLALSAKPTSLLSRLLTSRPAVMLGTYSYGMYVWHNIPRYWLGHQGLGPKIAGLLHLNASAGFLVSGVVACAGSILVAMVSYHAFEAWFLKLKKHFSVREPTDPDKA
ncbi:MAG: acyltransferase family protein [Phycisphaerales bacterium JB063]